MSLLSTNHQHRTTLALPLSDECPACARSAIQHQLGPDHLHDVDENDEAEPRGFVLAWIRGYALLRESDTGLWCAEGGQSARRVEAVSVFAALCDLCHGLRESD